MTVNKPPREEGTRSIYNQIAKHFARTRQHPWPETAKFIQDQASLLISKGDDGTGKPPLLLDLGSGNGRNSLFARELGFSVLALDFSRELLTIQREISRELKPQVPGSPVIETVEADLLALPLADSSVDSTLGVAVLHHLESRERRLWALRECLRVLKPGGRALFTVWAFDQPRFSGELARHQECFSLGSPGFGDVLVDWNLQAGDSVSQAEEPRVFKRFYHLFLENELDELCQEADFMLISSFRAGDNYYAILKKRQLEGTKQGKISCKKHFLV